MWTPDALRSELRACCTDLWRTVETQYKASTMRLTDSLEEQELLEDILNRSKPPIPAECAGFHYLIYTPFRYAPYPVGSRFRRAGQREGAFYGSEEIRTAVAEMAFYRLLFLIESPDTILPSAPVEHTVFSVGCSSERLIDLTLPPLKRDMDLWTHPTNYEPCQALSDSARAAGVEIIRYKSIRDPARQANCAVLSPCAFSDRRPKTEQTWHVFPGSRSVRAWCENPRFSLEFSQEDFNNDPRISTMPTRHRTPRRRK
jgi:RES domain